LLFVQSLEIGGISVVPAANERPWARGIARRGLKRNNR
jgi:hypothetical protein